MGRALRGGGVYVLVAVGLLAIAGCRPGAKKPGPGAEGGKERPTPVEVVVIQRGAIESAIKATSELETELSVQVFANTSNYVEELMVEEGDLVEAGDILLRLENDIQQTQYDRAQVRLDTLERDFERQKALYAENLISEQAFADFETQLKEQRLAVADAQRELRFTEVRAKIRGTISERLVNLGDNVNSGQQLFTIVDFESMIARVYLPETDLRRLSVGLGARVEAPALGSETFDAYVKRIAPTVDPNTGLIKVTIGFREVGTLLPGMFANVEIVTATQEDAILVPKATLVYDGEQTYVFRLDPDSEPPERLVSRVLVSPLLEDKENMQPEGGIEVGDQLVVAGKIGLSDGAKVRLPGDPEPEDDSDSEASSKGDSEKPSAEPSETEE